MSSSPGVSPDMNMPDNTTALEERLRRISAAFPYPATPDLAARERQRLAGMGRARAAGWPRRLAVGLAVLLILFMAAMLVTPVRARVLDWIRIGSVRIFFFLPTPTSLPPVPSGTPSPASTSTPKPTPTFLQSVLDLSGETTFEDAQERAGFEIQMPSYPADLDAPDHVYLQDFNRRAVVMVWMDDAQPGKVRMSLTESSSDSYMFEKYDPKSVEDIRVNGHAGVWIDGDYVLVMRDGDVTMTRMIDQSHTMIWNDGETTFRLETDETLEEAMKVAESIR